MKPGRTFFVISLLLVFLGAAGFFYDQLILVWFFSAAVIVPIIIIDLLILLLFTDRLQVKRELNSALVLGRKAIVRLTISASEQQALIARSIKLFDIYPDTLECSIFPVTLKQKSLKQTVIFEYAVTPHERGPWEFLCTEFLLGSPMGFWQLKVIHPCENRGRTFPDFKKLASNNAELRGVLEQTGVKLIRKRGQQLQPSALSG